LVWGWVAEGEGASRAGRGRQSRWRAGSHVGRRRASGRRACAAAAVSSLQPAGQQVPPPGHPEEQDVVPVSMTCRGARGRARGCWAPLRGHPQRSADGDRLPALPACTPCLPARPARPAGTQPAPSAPARPPAADFRAQRNSRLAWLRCAGAGGGHGCCLGEPGAGREKSRFQSKTP
jgi:hypothetical protein